MNRVAWRGRVSGIVISWYLERKNMWKGSMVLPVDARIFGSCLCSILGPHPFEVTS